jgi:hypothetical protein
MLKGVHRRSIGIGNDGQMMAPQGLETGGDGKPTIVFPSPDNVAVFDDFLDAGDTGSTPDAMTKFRQGYWVKGFHDTGQMVPSTGIVGNSFTVGFTNGIYRMTSSATSGQDVITGTQSLNSPRGWKANQGRLRFGARLKIDTLAGNSLFVGFTDTGGNELAVYDTGGGILTPASDYVGFICSGEGGATQQAWRAVAGAATVDQSATTGVTPVAGVYTTLELEVGSTGGPTTFWIDGKPVAQIASASVTATVALAGGVWRANTDGAADAIDIDWMNVSAARDTGT